MPQSDLAVKVKGQTKISRQMHKIETHTITLSLTSQEDTKWHKNEVTNKSRRSK